MADDMAVRARGSAVAAAERVSDPALPGDAATFQLASRGTRTGWDASPRGAPPRGDNKGGNAPGRTGGTQRFNPPSGPRGVNNGIGSRFNWRDYITVIHDTSLLDEKGQPTDRLLRFPAEERERIGVEALRQRENEQVTERALDQLSRIPEFQASIRKAHIIFSAKVAADPELTKESGGKLRVSLSDGKTEFNPATGTMNLNARDVASSRYMTADGPKPFSLQGVLVHELAGHGSDGSLTPEKDLNQRKEALTKALVGVFRYYPDLKAEYERSRTILGKPVGDLFSAPDAAAFDSKFKSLRDDGSTIDISRENLEKRVVGRYPPDMRSFEVFNGALNILYKGELDDIVERQDETPVIEWTNKIMEKYYGEPKRVGYAAVRQKSEDLVAPPPSLADFTYPGIRLNPGKLAPRRLHAIQR